MLKRMMMVAGALALAGFVSIPGLVAFGQDDASPGKKDARKSDNAAVADKKGDAKKAGKPQTDCPVMGGKVDKKLFVDVKGKRIYICCQGCVSKIRSDPGKYIKILEDQGVEIEKAPTEDTKKTP